MCIRVVCMGGNLCVEFECNSCNLFEVARQCVLVLHAEIQDVVVMKFVQGPLLVNLLVN